MRTGRTWWYAAVPAVFMVAVTLTSLGILLVRFVREFGSAARFDPNGPVCAVLFLLAVLLLVETASAVSRTSRDRRSVAPATS
jgi:branched-subunit amino acid permease